MKALHHAPLLKVALMFLLGITVQLHLEGWAFWYLSTLCIPLVGMWWFRHAPLRQETQKSLLLLLVFFCLGMAWSHVRQPSPDAKWSFLEGKRAVLHGVAARHPKATPYGRYTWIRLYEASTDSVAQRGAGTLVLYLNQEDTTAFQKGDSLLVLADVRKASSKNQGYLDYLHDNAIFHMANARQIGVRTTRSDGFNQTIRELQARLGEALHHGLQDSTSLGVAKAMFLGDKQDLNKDTKAAFAATGLSHILAVSGLHVGIIFLGLGFLFHPVTRLKRGNVWKQLLVLTGILLYMMIAGAGAAVVRAVMMFGIILIIKLLGKRTHLLNALAFSAWVQMLHDPRIILDVGFQLSYSAVIGIFLVLPWLENLWPNDAPVWLKHLYSGMGVTLSATLFTTPFILYYFGTFPTWFLVSNVLVSFLAFPLILTGFFSLLVMAILPSTWLSTIMAELTGTLLDILLGWVHLVNALPVGSLTATQITPAHGWVIGAQIMVAFALFRLPVWLRRPGHQQLFPVS